ncbi:hypothetical protein C4K22_4946 [Pseudomonas chlororaphis subsp. aurantiaca]|nr:hypothetical protein C4K22_4946 [Pseudomonas chlororaphis subsp. aurantiaca]AZD44006.1 hypothetical protein C4K21_4954 [Pseudomonas chlororaphis subsp. aurantiaca]
MLIVRTLLLLLKEPKKAPGTTYPKERMAYLRKGVIEEHA